MSYSAKPAVTEPPGELMYMYIGFTSSESRKSMTAMIWFTGSSMIGCPMNMMRSRYSRL